MSENWTADDDLLLAALGKALHAADDMPASFVESAKACYSWYTVDSELAELTYDSALPEFELPELATTRAESASVQALTFASNGLTIELEISDRILQGQLVPCQEGEIEMHRPSADVTIVRCDESGYFRFPVIPTGPFRLRCRTDAGVVVTTRWVTLGLAD